MCLNRTSELKVLTIWISRELPLFNFERLYMWCAWSDHRVKSNDKLNFSRASVVQLRASRHIMHPNRTSVWKIMTNWISRELPMFNFERLDILLAWIGPECDMLWPFEIHKGFRYSISSISIYYKPESDIRVKSYDHLNFSRASVVQFRASGHLMHPNRTSVWKVMTIWISRELPMFNFERIDIL